MATPYDVLARAHELIEQGWTQHHLARDAQGWARGYTSAFAVQFCMLGALHRAAAELDMLVPQDALHSVAREAGLSDIVEIPGWNDQLDRTQAEVLAVFARAAETVRGEGEK